MLHINSEAISPVQTVSIVPIIPLLSAFSTLQTKHYFHIMPPPFLWFTVVHFSPSTFHACFITQLKPTHLNWKPRARDQIIESSLSPLPNGSPWPGEIGVHTTTRSASWHTIPADRYKLPLEPHASGASTHPLLLDFLTPCFPLQFRIHRDSSTGPR